MSKKILFWPDVYKEEGHWLPTFAWADYLYSRCDTIDDEKVHKYEVEYMGICDCGKIISDYVTVNPISEKKCIYHYNNILSKTYPKGYTNEIQTTPSNRWKTDHIWVMACAGYEDAQMSEFPFSANIISDAVSLRNTITTRQPDMLVSGYFTSLETLILYYHSKNTASSINGQLKQFAISTTYLRHPNDDPAIHALQNLMAFSPEEQNMLINIVRNHQTNPNLWHENCNCTLEEFVAPLRTFNELIPCPQQFDYKNYANHHGALVHYGEPCIVRELMPVDDDGSVEWDDVLEKPNLIFVTAGSQILDYEDSALSLFKSMIDAMASAEMKDYHLILCVGSTLIQKNWEHPDNVTVCGWAPQRRILNAMHEKLQSDENKQKTCCAIIHGGLATIKECIYYEIPFLVLPLGKDQMDNALRLEDCGIKNRFHIEYIKPRCLLYFIDQILHDYTSLSNLKKMSSLFRSAEAIHPNATRLAMLASAIPEQTDE